MTTDSPALLDGGWHAAGDGSWLTVLDPADLRQVVGRVPALTPADVGHAYDGAATGARLWRGTDVLSRGAVLLTAARLLRDRAAEIVADLVAEMGKTVAEASVEVAKSADFFEYYGGMARSPADCPGIVRGECCLVEASQ
jgi:aldehyde dehydrogenase (NAD+)